MACADDAHTIIRYRVVRDAVQKVEGKNYALKGT